MPGITCNLLWQNAAAGLILPQPDTIEAPFSVPQQPQLIRHDLTHALQPEQVQTWHSCSMVLLVCIPSLAGPGSAAPPPSQSSPVSLRDSIGC